MKQDNRKRFVMAALLLTAVLSVYAQTREEILWAVDQLKTHSEAPDCPWPMKDVVGWESHHKKFFDSIEQVSADSVAHLKTALDARYQYNDSIFTIVKKVGSMDIRELEFSWQELQAEQKRYRSFHGWLSNCVFRYVDDFNLVKDEQGNLVPDPKNAQVIVSLAPVVRRQTGTGKFMFHQYKGGTVFAKPDEVKNAKVFVQFLRNIATLMDSPDVSKRDQWYYQTYYSAQAVEQAIVNNSKGNMTYVARPAGGSMNTAALKAAARQAVQARFPSMQIVDVVLTGNGWTDVRNVLGTVIAHFTNMTVIYKDEIGNCTALYTLGQKKRGSSWGAYYVYGIRPGGGDYVK